MRSVHWLRKEGAASRRAADRRRRRRVAVALRASLRDCSLASFARDTGGASRCVRQVPDGDVQQEGSTAGGCAHGTRPGSACRGGSGAATALACARAQRSRADDVCSPVCTLGRMRHRCAREVRGVFTTGRQIYWPTQCEGITSRGTRCSVFSAAGYSQARPLQRGFKFCSWHTWQASPRVWCEGTTAEGACCRVTRAGTCIRVRGR